jgi:hypothetical protein
MATSNSRAARERKQKIFVVVGGLFLLVLLAIQVPKLMGGSGQSEAAETTETTTTTADGQTSVPPVDAAVPVSIGLTDTDRPLALGPGQLRSLSTFERKDPFVQQIDPSADTDAPPGTGTSASAPAAKPKRTVPAKPTSRGFRVGGTATASVTVISVNGARQTLAAGRAFPLADPVFVLVSEQPEQKSVLISVAGGEYANGDQTTKLKVGEPVVLVNTTTGARYRLVLVSVGSGGATSAQGPATGGAGSTTAP